MTNLARSAAHAALFAIAVAAAVAAPAQPAGASATCSITVQPTQSISEVPSLVQAQRRVRQMLRSGATQDIVVCLAPGIYHHARSTLSFTEEDDACIATADVAACRANGSPTRVIWRSLVPGAAVISGGVQLTGWQQATLGGGVVYAVSVPSGTFAAGYTARSLWVSETRANRTVSNAAAVLGTMHTWVSSDALTMGYTVDGSVPAAWTDNNTNLIEFTWPIVLANWIAPRCTIASIAGINITLTSPCGGFLNQRAARAPPPPVTVEAAPTFPLAAGTFYHDAANDMLYYALAAGQTPADLEANAWVAPQEVLLSVANTTGHVWDGVAFAYATWNEVNTPDGYVEDQSCVILCSPASPGCSYGAHAPVHAPRADVEYSIPSGSLEPAGGVRVASSSGITFTNCSFTHFGAVYALSITDGSQRVTVDGCVFTDLSGGFLKLGNVSTANAGSPNPSNWDAGSLIANNVADNMALEYGGAAGLFAGYLFNATIANNDVSDAGYSGFSVGWGWGSSFPPGVGAITIANNRVYNVMRVLRDGGGIYVNGATNGSWPSVIRGNWVDHDNAVYAVFYLDNGASHWLVTENVASNAPLAWAFFMQGCCNLPALNSHVDNFWYASDETLAPQNNCAAQNCTVDSATVYAVTGGAWPAQAMAIMNATGPQPQ